MDAIFVKGTLYILIIEIMMQERAVTRKVKTSLNLGLSAHLTTSNSKPFVGTVISVCGIVKIF